MADTTAPLTFADKYNMGDISWMLTSTALVMLMTPGLALFYGGMARHKSALNLILLSMMAVGVITVQWFVVGYSISFSDGNPVFGYLTKAFFLNTPSDSSNFVTSVPEMVFQFFQMKFAIITPALITGATAERMKFSSSLIFLVLWSTFAYDPLAHMCWHPEGFLNRGGTRVLDFAGGIVVHFSSGVAALVAAIMLGRRIDRTEAQSHNPVLVALGTALLMFGWFGFNAGSAVAANEQAVNAFVVTHIASCFAAVTYGIVEYISSGKSTLTGPCVGFVVGLVGITPASGFVKPLPAMVIGIFSALACFYGIKLRKKMGYDDVLDVFACHGLGGLTGNMLTGVFAETVQPGGWMNHHWEQMGWQALGVVVCALWSGIVAFVILICLHYTLGIRVSKETEEVGLDAAVHGEAVNVMVASQSFNNMTKIVDEIPGRSNGVRVEASSSSLELLKTSKVTVTTTPTPTSTTNPC